MPVPDRSRDDKARPDYSFLMDLVPGSTLPKKKLVQASNQDASLLFKIWASGEKSSEDTVKISSLDISSREIMRLKTMGFLTGGTDEVTFTRKGKVVITTMVLGETNKFEKSKQEKSYTEILASMSKRGKKGFRTAQYAPCSSNCLNLRNFK